MSLGKFLGYLVTHRGIEANPKQIQVVQNIQEPKTTKNIQKLTGMLTALNRFIFKSSDRCKSFFAMLKGVAKGTWDEECGRALEGIKEYLKYPPTLSVPAAGEILNLYLSVSKGAVNGALVRESEGAQRPIYFVSKTLLDAETRYLPIEKLVLALVVSARKLKHYF